MFAGFLARTRKLWWSELRNSRFQMFCRTAFWKEKTTMRLFSVFAKFFRIVNFWKWSESLPSWHNDVITTLLRRCYPTSLWRCHIVAMETLDDVAKTTSLQCLILRDVIMRRCNDVVFATLSDVSITTMQQLQTDVGWRRRNDVVKLFCLIESKYR